MPDRLPDAPVIGRRTAVLGVGATFLLAACDHGDDVGGPGATATSSSSGSSGGSSSAPAQTPDEALVDEVSGQLGAALTVLAGARRARGLGPALGSLIGAHRRHLEVLEGPPPAAAPAGPRPQTLPALRAVRHSETQLQATLVAAAGRAESGALAKLLASISASVTQHLAALPKDA